MRSCVALSRVRVSVTSRRSRPSFVDVVPRSRHEDPNGLPRGAVCVLRWRDRLFLHPNPGAEHEDGDFLRDINPDSLKTLTDCAVESYAVEEPPGTQFQFERTGYFCVDQESTTERVQFNRVATLRDSWAKKA